MIALAITENELREMSARREVRVSGQGRWCIWHHCQLYAQPMTMVQRFQTELARTNFIEQRVVPRTTLTEPASGAAANFKCAACRMKPYPEAHFLFELE